MLRSIVEYFSGNDSYKCGYCKSPDSNYSHGMWAHALTVSDYQDLIDRGWRRSGKYCYKPTMDVTCCPMYTIRCRALEFKATKSQKKVLKRFNKFLVGDELINLQGGDAEGKMSTCSGDENEEGMGEQFVETTKEHQVINIEGIKDCADVPETNAGEAINSMETSNAASITDINKQKDTKKGDGADPAKAPCKKAKQLRRERKLEKLKDKGVDISTWASTNKNKEKQIEDFIDEIPSNFKQRLEVRLVRTTPPSPEWLATAKETYQVYVKYQTTIHNDKPEKCTEPKFQDFLVKSPLLAEHSEAGPPCGYGSFHQQYLLDGKIIAVGVIDILPKCVSSVYFFYDPQYMFLTLGTYGALREIAFTRHLHTLSPQLQYYYMGYYIHSCRKMRYKGNFYPSDLACPETYNFFPLKDCIPKLESSAYSRLDPDIDNVDSNYPKDSDLNYLRVLVNSAVMPYKMYKRKYAHKTKDTSTEVAEYARLVGAKSAKSLILVR